MFKDFTIWCVQISHFRYWSLVASPKCVATDWKPLLWSCRRWEKKAQCAMWQMCVLGNVWTSKLIMQGDMASTVDTEYSESLLDQYYKHYACVCPCFPDAKLQEYQTHLEKASFSRACLFIPAYTANNQEGKGWKKHLCSKHVYKGKNWKSDKLAPALPRISHNQ